MFVCVSVCVVLLYKSILYVYVFAIHHTTGKTTLSGVVSQKQEFHDEMCSAAYRDHREGNSAEYSWKILNVKNFESQLQSPMHFNIFEKD